MTVRAPIMFLDAFFSRARENAAAFGDKSSASFDEFVKYYQPAGSLLRRRLVAMPRTRCEALVLACLLFTGCKQACVEQIDSEPVERDFSDLRLSGDYRCNLQSTCTVLVSKTSAVLTAKNESDGAEFRIDYKVQYGEPTQENLDVTQGASVDPRCGATVTYREETWTVPSVTFEAQSATQNGQALDLATDVRILNHKSSLLRKLVVMKHYIDVSKNEEYLGVQVTSEPRSYLRLPITRTGDSFTIGPGG